MAELFAEYNGIYGKGFFYIQDLFPADSFDLVIHFIGVLGSEAFDWF